jgi:glycopeptide antibiotics resistance protein
MRPPGVLDLVPGIVVGYVPFALIVLAVLGAGLFALRSRRVSRVAAARTTALDLAVGTWLALTLLVTVVPMGESGPRPPIALIPFLDVIQRVVSGVNAPSSEASDLVLNVLLFMPFGAWAAVRLGRTWMAAAIAGGAVLSIGIELSQAIEATGRSASTTDVVTNTAGAALGFLVELRIRDKSAALVDDRTER